MTQPEQRKTCPFKVAALIGNSNPRAEYDLTCEPKYCALGIPEANRCALKPLAHTTELCSRLSAILAHLAGYTPPEPNLHSPGQPRSHEPAPPLCPNPLKKEGCQT